jgi:signal recognition particle GTPase
MPHTLIVGQTNTGKTTLALKMCEAWKRAGFVTLVLDPTLDTRWRGMTDLHTADKETFLRAYFNSRNARVFIDESIEVASNSDKDIIYTATRGRHYGHCNVYISQRANSVARNIHVLSGF